jgi:CRP/FNR family transcriptional regulator, cyclic AMP receptor protein
VHRLLQVTSPLSPTVLREPGLVRRTEHTGSVSGSTFLSPRAIVVPVVSFRLLSDMSEDDGRSVLARCRRRRFRRGEVVFHDGDPGEALHLVAKGRFAVRVTTPLGDTAMLRVFRTGDYFGELAALERGPRTGTVLALEDGETLCLHHEELNELRAQQPAIDQAILAALAGEVRRLAGSLVEALYLPVERRLWRRLVDLADVYADGGAPVAVPFTQEELAQLAGTTRSTANRVLRAGETAGVVRVTRRRIEVVDLPAVRALAH